MLGRSVKRTGSVPIGRVLALGLIGAVLSGSLPAQTAEQDQTGASTTNSNANTQTTAGWLQERFGRVGQLLRALSQASETPASRGSEEKPKPAGPVVTASHPVTREVVEWDEYTGRVEAVETVEIRARVPGYLDRVHFKDGQVVAKGDLLYTIDPRPFERALETAQAELQQAKVKVENATRDVERGRPLLERQYLSQRLFDERENLQRDSRAAVAVAEAKVKSAELELSFTRITAPIAGRISMNMLDIGNYVAAGISESSSLLTTIVSQDPVHVYFDVGENNALKYRRLRQAGQKAGAGANGAPVYVGLPDETGYPHKAALDFSDNRLDRGTGTLRVRAELSNKAGLFQPGMFVRVRIPGSPSYPAVMIPDEAIGTDQASKFVYVVDDNDTAHRKWVRLGPLIDGLRIVREGIAPDDWVIVKGIQRARPDAKVTARREPLQVSAAPSNPARE